MSDPLKGVTDKTVRAVLRDARRAGCEIRWTGKGHIRVDTPGGPVFVGGTPGDQKVATHLRVILRRKGVELN